MAINNTKRIWNERVQKQVNLPPTVYHEIVRRRNNYVIKLKLYKTYEQTSVKRKG